MKPCLNMLVKWLIIARKTVVRIVTIPTQSDMIQHLSGVGFHTSLLWTVQPWSAYDRTALHVVEQFFRYSSVGIRDAHVFRSFISHRQQAPNTACDRILGHLWVRQTAELFQRRLTVLHAQRPSLRQVFRDVITQNGQGTLHTCSRRHSRPRRTPQISIVKIGQAMCRSVSLAFRTR